MPLLIFMGAVMIVGFVSDHNEMKRLQEEGHGKVYNYIIFVSSTPVFSVNLKSWRGCPWLSS